MVLAICQQLGGLAIIFTYSTCKLAFLGLADSFTDVSRFFRSCWSGRSVPRHRDYKVCYPPDHSTPHTELRCSCVNLLAVLTWALSTDKLGRRTIITSAETLLVAILFIVGGLHWSGATDGSPSAGITLVSCSCLPRVHHLQRTYHLTNRFSW